MPKCICLRATHVTMLLLAVLHLGVLLSIIAFFETIGLMIACVLLFVLSLLPVIWGFVYHYHSMVTIIVVRHEEAK